MFDPAGNSFHLYARFDHYDKVAHLIGVAAAALFPAALMRGHVSGRVALAAVAIAGGLCIGIAIVPPGSSAHKVRPGRLRDA